MAAAAPHLHQAVRSFCLAAFARLGPDADAGDIPFVVESRGGLYEYRPLLRDHVEARVQALAQLEDARIALDELRREPATGIFAPAGSQAAAERALFRSILVPLLISTAEACGGFDWEDGAFERVYGELEESLFGDSRIQAAAAPLVGVSLGAPVELARGLRVRVSSAAELAARWSGGREYLPDGFGDEPERSCVLELEREVEPGVTALPDAAGELADAVTALRLATGAGIAAGAAVLRQLDRRPIEPGPMLGIAAALPAGEPTRLDPWRGKLAADLLARLTAIEEDVELGEAIERWELSLFEAGRGRAERLREALAAMLGGADGLWAAVMRASILIGETAADRAELADGLRRVAHGEADDGAAETVRRVLVETILHDDRGRLVAGLDDALLGLRPHPAGYFAARAGAA